MSDGLIDVLRLVVQVVMVGAIDDDEVFAILRTFPKALAGFVRERRPSFLKVIRRN
jgi:hypothetical protein